MYPKTRYVCRLRITDDIQLPFAMTVKGVCGGGGGKSGGRYCFCILNGRPRRSTKQTRVRVYYERSAVSRWTRKIFRLF